MFKFKFEPTHLHLTRAHCGNPHLRPPAGEHEVRVDVLLPELLRDVQTQGSVFVVNVPLGDI